MNRLLALLGMGVLVLMVTVSCNVIQKKTSVKELQLKDSGQTLSTTVGDTLKIVLDANETTGYTWEIKGYDKTVIRLDKSCYKVDSKLIGAPGKQIYFFKVIDKGETDLNIIYHRSWEKGVKPVKTFNLEIDAE